MNMKSPLLPAELSGCVVTTSQPQAIISKPSKGSADTDVNAGDSEEKPCYHAAAKTECDGVWSCSGVILDQTLGLVICQAAVFFPFLKEKDNDFVYSERDFLSAQDFPSDFLIQVECPCESKIAASYRKSLSNEVLDQRSGLGFVPVSKQQTQRRQYQADLLMLVPCGEFQKTFSRLFRKEDGWVFSSEEEKEYGAFQKDLAYMHWFAVLKLQSVIGMNIKMDIMQSSRLVKGSTVFACGSPFGSFYPDIFLNTISKGVLSNMAGDGNVVLLTDARCLPGSEGGGIYLFESGTLYLIGITVAPLCWKTNEWVGLTLACSISHIIESIIKASYKGNNITGQLAALEMGNSLVNKPIRSTEPMGNLLATTVLVDSGQSWGSGVLLNSKLVLTCRHVVRHSSKVSVKTLSERMTRGLHYNYKRWLPIKGQVVFSTQESSPYDIAVVELEEHIPDVLEPVLSSGYCAGDDVCIVGYGALGDRCGPSVTSGVLSAVISVDDIPVMLQTSCAVYGGSSGGPLYALPSGELLGIVASNTRDNSTGATYPHLNFSIPVTVLQAAVDRYKQFGDLRSFGELNKAKLAVRDAWRLQRPPEKTLQSKL
ncbi:peroxisomal leader peptide-processing protease-like [Hyperolius riggenbachi]|uniref:peroxisomal leader peptide-processing protease-like n=1 Tax=Hyperolius riggenbachi TaxID=752182 RepID=UPI0035A3A5C7